MKKSDYAKLYTLRSDGRYQGHYYDSSGKLHFVCDRDPERLHEKLEAKKKPAPTTFKDVAEAWEEQRREEVKDRTWANYRPHCEDLTAKYGDRPVESITAQEIDADLKQAKAQQYSRTVVNTRKVVWSGILDHALAEGKIPYNPAMSVKLPKGLKSGKRRAPEDDIVDIICRNAEDMTFGFIPFFLLCTGLRRTEALTTRTEHVDLKTWTITIPVSKTQAGCRTVPIIQPLRDPLRSWMDAHSGDWLFPYVSYNKRTGTHMTDSNWERAWLAYCKQYGWIDDKGNASIGAHNLRHGTATLLFESDVDVYTAQHILGHANVSTTMEIYTELRQKQQKKGITKFSRRMAKRMAKQKKTAV